MINRCKSYPVRNGMSISADAYADACQDDSLACWAGHLVFGELDICLSGGYLFDIVLI